MPSFQHKMIMCKRGVMVLPRIDDLTELSLSEPDLRAESSIQQFPIGTALITDDGVFRYVKNGGVAITCGKLSASPATLHADYDNDLAVAAAAAAAATSVTVTASANAAITANYFKDGWLSVNDAAGEGCCYKIKSHPAAAKSASCVLTLVDELEVALTTSSQVALQKNIYDAIIVSPTTPTGIPNGVTWISSFTASYYGWIKTKGIANVLTNGTLVVGKQCVVGLTTAGSVDVMALTEGTPNTAANQAVVGTVLKVAASTEYSLVKIDLDPSW